MPIPREQLRMTDEELAHFLRTERTARIATVSPGGEPHVSPLWFVWHEGALFITSLKRSRRTKDIERGSRVAACIDAGDSYVDLRGVVLYGRFESAGSEDQTAPVRKLFGEKYWNGIDIPERRSHQWLRMEPDKIVSWDFAKIPAGRDRQADQAKS